MNNAISGFNGQRLDSVSGYYPLGNGYRCYNPPLRRFNAADNLSPFGAGGINPYCYCVGDPVNRNDPSGHFSWQAGLGIGLGIIGIAAALFTGGSSLIAAGGLDAALASASTISLLAGTSGMVADISGIASVASAGSNPHTSSVLGWISFASGILSLGAGIVAGGFSALRALARDGMTNRGSLSEALTFELSWQEVGEGNLLGADTASSSQRLSREPIRAYIADPNNFSHEVDEDDSFRITSTDLHHSNLGAENIFINRFTPDEWRFIKNFRQYKYVPYYASDVARYQYELISGANGFADVMPHTITRQFVSNLTTLEQTEGKTGRALFDAFFTTPNGKTTQHLMSEFRRTAYAVERERIAVFVNFYVRLNR